MSAPHTMVARRERIRGLITTGSVSSQEGLRTLLAGEGIAVTQATLSRDLDAIGAVKSAGPDGEVRYVLREPANVARLQPSTGVETVTRLVGEVLVGADSAENLAVLRTPPGAAMYLAGALDRSGMADLLGTVAGDDTVLVVMRNAEAAEQLCALLLSMAEGHVVSSPPMPPAPARRRSTTRRSS